MKKIVPIILLIAVNMYPLFGFLFWGWEVQFALFNYLVETIIIVIFSTVKMIMAKKLWDEYSAKLNPAWQKINRKSSLLNLVMMMWIFLFVICGVFILPFAGDRPDFSLSSYDWAASNILYFILLSFVSHLTSFIFNFILNDDRNTIEASRIFNRVMIGRIMPLFLSPFLIFFILPILSLLPQSLNRATIAVFILIGIFDVLAHIREHS